MLLSFASGSCLQGAQREVLSSGICTPNRGRSRVRLTRPRPHYMFQAPVCSLGNDKDRALPEGVESSRPAGKGSERVGFVGADRLGVSFTCTAADCGTRVSKMIRRSSYERGTVLIQCPTCKVRHLISDHLGWYSSVTGGKNTIEEIIQGRGEQVVRVNSDVFQLEKLVSLEPGEDNVESLGPDAADES